MRLELHFTETSQENPAKITKKSRIKRIPDPFRPIILLMQLGYRFQESGFEYAASGFGSE